jgi:hypothetical protein
MRSTSFCGGPAGAEAVERAWCGAVREGGAGEGHVAAARTHRIGGILALNATARFVVVIRSFGHENAAKLAYVSPRRPGRKLARMRARGDVVSTDVSLQTTYLVCFSEFVPSNPIAMAEAGGDAHVKYVEPTYLMRPYEEKKCVCAAVFAL